MVLKERCVDDIVRVEFRKGGRKYVTEISLDNSKTITADVAFVLLQELKKFLGE